MAGVPIHAPLRRAHQTGGESGAELAATSLEISHSHDCRIVSLRHCGH